MKFASWKGESIMKNLTYLIIVLLATLALVFTTKTAMTQDLAKVSPQDVKVLLENDRVRVLEVVHKPGAIEPMHSHPAYLTYFLTDTKLKITLPDGKTEERDRKAGQVRWSEPVTHSVENIGTTEQHFIIIELKK
jgi:quercetin dioxygenase-like cupin family protein